MVLPVGLPYRGTTSRILNAAAELAIAILNEFLKLINNEVRIQIAQLVGVIITRVLANVIV